MPSLYQFVNAPLALTVGDISGLTALDEIDPSPVERWSNDGLAVTQTLKCPWAERNTLIKALLGDARLVGSPAGGGVARTEIVRAMVYKPTASPGFPRAIAVRAEATPFTGRADTASSTAEPKQAIVTVGYETMEYDQVVEFDGVRPQYIIEQMEGATEFLTVPPDGKLFWTQGSPPTDEVKVDEVGGRVVRMRVWIVTFRWLAAIPDAMWDLAGTTNLKDQHSPKFGKTFAGDELFGGELLFGDPTIIHKVTPGGTGVWDVEIPMSKRPFGWNKYYRPGQQDPVPMYNADGTEFLQYPPADWSTIIP